MPGKEGALCCQLKEQRKMKTTDATVFMQSVNYVANEASVQMLCLDAYFLL